MPEIETLRSDLYGYIVGNEVTSVTVNKDRSIRRHKDVAEFSDALEGAVVSAIRRRGKYLVFEVTKENSRFALVAHMGMSGQLRVFGRADDFPKHSHIVTRFSNGLFLDFVDPRTFGQMYIDKTGDTWIPESLSHLGVDPISDSDLMPKALERYCTSDVGVKWQMLDQSKVCGIGNMYADEILFRSGIRFDRPGSSLTDNDLDTLATNIANVLWKAIQLRGSSLRDLQYRDIFGGLGGFQVFHRVYGREGLPCGECSTLISRVFSKGRSSFLCNNCQC